MQLRTEAGARESRGFSNEEWNNPMTLNCTDFNMRRPKWNH
jgi:hypothetical protein